MFKRIQTDDHLAVKKSLSVLHKSFVTVADEFGLTSKNSPTNPAFISEERFRDNLKKGVEFYLYYSKGKPVGCVAIEKAKGQNDLFYIERLGVIPENRHRNIGKKLMEFATRKIVEQGGKCISIGVIDENQLLKEWYRLQGFKEKKVEEFDHLPFTVCFMERRL